MTSGRIAAAIAFCVVAGGLVAGFSLTGSPQHERARALDDRRMEDLQTIANALSRRHLPALPASLPPDLLATRPDGSDATRDPVTHEPYRYARDGAQHFKLCATFTMADNERRWPSEATHPAGRACLRFHMNSAWQTPEDAVAER
jgi:hypothetical protein